MTIKEFVKFRAKKQRAIARMQDSIDDAEETVALPTRGQVRSATASDITEGAVIIHRVGTKDAYWHTVEEVRWPDDPFKAYVADDGCRYGLDNAWVLL